MLKIIGCYPGLRLTFLPDRELVELAADDVGDHDYHRNEPEKVYVGLLVLIQVHELDHTVKPYLDSVILEKYDKLDEFVLWSVSPDQEAEENEQIEEK